MKADKMDTGKENPESGIFFAPLEEIRIIERIIVNLEKTRRELQKVAEGMKIIEN